MRRGIVNPIHLLRSLFPWPAEKPDVPERHERWFNQQKQILLRKVIPHDVGLVVELGSWLGDSTRWFCEWCPEATVIAVDTWFGSVEHLLRRRSVLPMLYDTFLANCWEYRNRLIPFRNTSLAALNFLYRLELEPDMIYFDSDHSFWGLLAELETSHALFPRCIFVGDDYGDPTIGNALKTFVEYQQPSKGISVQRRFKVNNIGNTWHIVKE